MNRREIRDTTVNMMNEDAEMVLLAASQWLKDYSEDPVLPPLPSTAVLVVEAAIHLEEALIAWRLVLHREKQAEYESPPRVAIATDIMPGLGKPCSSTCGCAPGTCKLW